MQIGDKVIYRNYRAEIVMLYDTGCTVKFRRGSFEVHRYCFYEELEPDLQISFAQ